MTDESLIKKLRAKARSMTTGHGESDMLVYLSDIESIIREHDTRQDNASRCFVEAFRTERDQSAPTEAMCDRARGFIMGLDLNCRTWASMKQLLDNSGYPTLPRIDHMAVTVPMGHITKWDVAECIYLLMTSGAAA